MSLPEDVLLRIEHYAELASFSAALRKDKKSPLKEYAKLLLEELNHRTSKPSPEDIELYLKVFKIEFSRRLRNKMLLQKLDKKE